MRIFKPGIRRKTVEKKLRTDFKGVSKNTYNQVIDFAKETRDRAAKAKKSGPKDKLIDLTADRFCPRPKVLRVGYTLDVFDPNLDEMRPYGGYMDFDILSNVETAKQKILASVVDTLIKYYEYSKITPSQLMDLYSSLEFQSVTCIQKDSYS